MFGLISRAVVILKPFGLRFRDAFLPQAFIDGVEEFVAPRVLTADFFEVPC